ncbi:DNA repair protein RecN [Alkalihalobacterium chitinilyticum]|uniref:DNA repair protein RecN n=1 Tax=Alkalihalobacterium chitinilyticum TaxID=2980103 RepID=A0ABT5V9V8_9BACI|nr:DNA repair protein RecN [Alkalihalobacterium chitinilyticum]MDE5412236.1 DNA repair protein RecN [Alkalihalobacterium chitinilyticum]
MLVELSIKNFAIIDELIVSLNKGLTVLTGETGAGKSIIIDAIGLLVGGRGSTEFIRYGANRAEIEGLFSIEQDHPVIEKAKSLGIDVEEGMIIVRRDLTTHGKSICRLNGKLVTLGIIREIGQTLVDIHGQHEHQALLQQDRHIAFLDSFAKDALKSTKSEYQLLFKKFNNVKNQLEQMNKNEQELAHRTDLIQYQLNEIEKAKLRPHEDEDLLEEKLKLANNEKLYKALHASYNSLYGEGKGLDWIHNALSHAEEAVEIDPKLKKLVETVSSCYYLLEEASFSLSHQFEHLEFDPNRLEMIETRLNEISFLKKKYGTTVDEILEYAAKVEDELDTLVNKEDRIQSLQNELDALRLDLEVEANALSAIRKDKALQLSDLVHQQLQALYMEKTKFTVEMNKIPNGRFTEDGVDTAEFYISPNPGEPLKPLSKVASGGEISRIMLAMKTIFSTGQGVTSLIFDEVDTGVSGRVAQAIAEKIYQIASKSQVLCITHLPQVAAMADQHLYISKQQIEERTKTNVRQLTTEEKVHEVARMISGVEVTELTKEHANELLILADQIKTNT